MLNKRANILLKEEEWKKLAAIAKRQKTSAGELIRQAINRIYFEKNIKDERKRALQEILKIRPHFKGTINYKELINYGRKY